jgi:CRISPR-associated protein Csx17
MPTLHLAGCAPKPLAHYLKALGIMRIVAQQADPDAAGYWHRDDFVLRTTLDAESLTAFFLESYAPTPVLAPWNGGSGFFQKDNKDSIALIQACQSPRFACYRETLTAAQALLAHLKIKDKPDPEIKGPLLQACRNTLPEAAIAWLDAAFVLSNEGAKYPPLLGTGGNDGRLEFTNNFMQRLAEVFDLSTGASSLDSKSWLRQSLFSDTIPVARVKAPIGQFFPSAAGGANATNGFNSDASANPWDFIFMIEGALVFAAAAVKRLESIDDGRLAYPFCVRQAGIGYASSSAADESASRAEMWMPLWEKPATYAEVSALFSEGRAQVGARSARNGVDFIRAVVTLGVDRGITAFQRFGFQVRNGLAYFAIPLERVIVRQHTRANLLIEIDHWLDQLRRFSGDGPASISRALRGIETAIDELCRHDDAPRFRSLLVALGRAERALARSFRWTTEKRLQPLKELTANWIKYASDSPDTDSELRLASALAAAYGGALRSHLEPVEGRGYWTWSTVPSNNVCWNERGLESVLLDILTRRLAAPERAPSLDQGHAACYAFLDDIESFIRGELDDELIADLWWALSALDWRSARRFERPLTYAPPSALFSLLRLCFPQPGELRYGAADVPPVPAILAKARTGQCVEASKLAVHRLRASGFRPRLDSIDFGAAVTKRTAAALLFPLHPHDFSRLQTSILREAANTQV